MDIFLKPFLHPRHRWSLHHQIQFFYHVQHYTEHGIPLIETLQLLKSTFPKRYTKDFERLLERLKEGEDLYQIFSDLHFEADVVSLFEMGKDIEKSRYLFQKCYHLLEQKRQFRQFVSRLFSYPIFLLLLVILSGIFMSNTILPQYEELVPHNGTWLSGIYFFMNHFFTRIPTILAYVFIGIVVTFLLYPSFPIRLQIAFLHISQQFPVYGNISKKFQSYYLLQLLLSTLKSQLTLAEGVDLFSHSQNKLTQYQAQCLAQGFHKGNFLYETIQAIGLYDRQFEAVLFHAQTHGHLLKELEGFSVLLKEQIYQIIQKGLRVFQIFTFLLVGLYIFALYGAVLLPMYALFETF